MKGRIENVFQIILIHQRSFAVSAIKNILFILIYGSINNRPYDYS